MKTAPTIRNPTTFHSRPSQQSLADLLEQISRKLDEGQLVDVDEWTARYPDHAERLRELIPTMLAMAQWGNSPATMPLNDSTSKHESPVAGVLGDFRILRELGRGGMGTVFEAEQISMGRRVALKVLPFAALAQDKALQRFRNEVRAVAALDHPHIVSVYSVGEERGIHYYAMQLINGPSLADSIRQLRSDRKNDQIELEEHQADGQSKRRKTPSASTWRDERAWKSTAIDSQRPSERFSSIARLGIQAAEALQHAHGEGVLHRDIKPSNLMLDANGKLFITDFGLARIGADVGMTITGDILGTLRYMPPEQALAKRGIIDHRADIYALGATLYELLTLRAAFDGDDRGELLRQIAFDEPISPRKLDKRIPVDLETVVLKAMAKDPNDRYETAQQLADDLRAVLEHRSIQARAPSSFERVGKWTRRHPASTTATAVTLILLTLLTSASTFLVAREKGRAAEALTQSKQALRESEERLKLARQAVDEMYVEVAEQWLGREGHLLPLQREFLEKARTFYRRFSLEEGSDRQTKIGAIRAEICVGDIEHELGNFETAIETYQRAISRLEPLMERFPTDISGGSELAWALNSHGKVHWIDDEFGLALPLFERAAHVQEQVVDALPDATEHRNDLAGYYIHLGRLYLAMSRHSEAESALWRSLEMIQVVVNEESGDPVSKRNWAYAENQLGQLLASTGRVPEARRHFRRALDLGEELLALDPRDLEVRYALALFLNSNAQHLPPPQRSDAMERAFKLLDGLVAENPNNPNYLMTVVDLKQGYASSLSFTGKSERAEPILRAALPPAERLSREFGNVPMYRQCYSSVLSSLGECLGELGKTNEQAEIFRREGQEIRRMAAQYPDDRSVQFDLTLTKLTEWAEAYPESEDDIDLSGALIGAAIHLFSRAVGASSDKPADDALSKALGIETAGTSGE